MVSGALPQFYDLEMNGFSSVRWCRAFLADGPATHGGTFSPVPLDFRKPTSLLAQMGLSVHLAGIAQVQHGDGALYLGHGLGAPSWPVRTRSNMPSFKYSKEIFERIDTE